MRPAERGHRQAVCGSRPSLYMKCLGDRKARCCKMAETEDKLGMHLSLTKANQVDAAALQDRLSPLMWNGTCI